MPLRADDLKATGNILTQRAFRTTENIVTVELELSGMADGQVAGLCHFSRDYATIAVRRSDGASRMESARGKEITGGAAIVGEKIWIRSTWSLDGSSAFSYSADGEKFTPFGEPYQLGWGHYRGNRIGIFTYNNTGEAGYVDVNAFTYDYAGPQSRRSSR